MRRVFELNSSCHPATHFASICYGLQQGRGLETASSVFLESFRRIAAGLSAGVAVNASEATSSGPLT